MENASKALIIAGAILISILIITLGIMIYGQAKGAIDTNAMSELEIRQFNEKFMQYEGNRVRGATVNSLLQSVVAHNLSADDDSKRIKVTSTYTGTTERPQITLEKNASSVTTKARTGSTYSVTCVISDGNTNGDGANPGNKGLVYMIQLGDPN